MNTGSSKFLPFSAPWFGAEEREELIATLDSDWITTGPRTKKFEQEFAAYVGTREAVAVNSCTAALHLALAVLDIGHGDAVITTPFTFAATANVIVHRGALPVFVDIDPATQNLDPGKLERFLETRCRYNERKRRFVLKRGGDTLRAIIPVHYGGQPYDVDAIHELCERYGLMVIEDAAHAAGARYKGRKVGTLGTMACFSFYANKNMTTAEGGMLTTNEPALAECARVLSLHGISGSAWRRYSKEGTWRYDVLEAGYKYNMPDLAAALGLHQLRKLDGFIARREHLAGLYTEALSGLGELQLPAVAPDLRSAWHLYPVQVNSAAISRDELINQLRQRNVGCSVHFIPLHLMSYYQQTFGCRVGDFPVAEQVFKGILSLPLYPRMHDSDVAAVSGHIWSLLRSAKLAHAI